MYNFFNRFPYYKNKSFIKKKVHSISCPIIMRYSNVVLVMLAIMQFICLLSL